MEDRMTNNVNSTKGLLITSVIVILLQGTLLIGVYGNRQQIKHDAGVLDFVSRDYAPTWLIEGLYENMIYQTEEIVATLNGDATKVKAINEKYIAFQKTMLNNLIQYRAGMTQNTRSGKSNE